MDDVKTMPLDELGALIREAEATARTDSDWQRASLLRHIFEMRKAGLPLEAGE